MTIEDSRLLNELIKQHTTSDGVVEVVHLAKSLGLEVYPVSLEDTVSGYLEYSASDNDSYIVVNKNHPATRQRFTVAHEIGHFVEHKDKLMECGRLDRKDDDCEYPELESSADSLAAEILMPKDLVKSYVKKMFGEKSFTANSIKSIASHFMVSTAMAITRLREIGYAIPYVSFA